MLCLTQPLNLKTKIKTNVLFFLLIRLLLEFVSGHFLDVKIIPFACFLAEKCMYVQLQRQNTGRQPTPGCT